MDRAAASRTLGVVALVLHSRRGRIALAAAVLASATASLDATIATVALPHIADDFDVGVGGLQWVITGYLLTLASCILLGGALGDRFGRRRVFRVGAVWFALASLACAIAPGLPALVAARMLQGVGGAMLAPSSLALTQSAFVAEDRASAVGSWSGLGGLAAAVGPLVGGLLVDGPGWRWAFLLNLPVLAAAGLASRALPADSDQVEDPVASNPRFDVLGAGLAVLALGSTTWALSEAADRGWTDPAILGAVGLGTALGVAFVVRERRVPAPLVPGVVFASPTFRVLTVATFVLYAALGVEFFLIVYQLQVTAGWTSLAAGSALLPATVLMLVGSAWSGDLAARIGPRPQLIGGPLLLAVAVLLLSRLDASADWATDVLPGAVVFGLGLVVFVAPLTATVMASVDEAHVSTASGVNNAVARTGGLFAVALVPTVSGLTTAEGPAAVTDAFQLAMWLTAGLAVLGALVCAVGLPRRATTRPSARRFHCAVDAAPLQPDPRHCPARRPSAILEM